MRTKSLAKLLTKKKQMIFLNIDLTIISWIKKKISYRKTTKSILSLFLNRRSQTNSSMKTQKRISNHWNLLRFPIKITEDKIKKLSNHYLNSTTQISLKELKNLLN